MIGFDLPQPQQKDIGEFFDAFDDLYLEGDAAMEFEEWPMEWLDDNSAAVTSDKQKKFADITQP